MVENNGRVILKYFPIPESDAITPSVTYKNLEDRIIIYGGGDIIEDIEILEEKVLSTNCKNILTDMPHY